MTQNYVKKELNKLLKDINEESVVGKTIKIYQKIDNDIDIKHKRRCPPKCNICCSDYFYISFAELLTIYFWVQEHNKQHRLVQKEYIPISINMLKQIEHLAPKEYQYLMYINRLLKEHHTFQSNSPSQEIFTIPCCFLNNKGKCSIYPVRPMICRFFGYCKKCDCEHLNQHSNWLYNPFSYFPREIINSHLWNQSFPLSVGFSLEVYFDYFFEKKLLDAINLNIFDFDTKYFPKRST